MTTRADAAWVQQQLQALGRTPNRALGQNFCVDGDKLAQMAAALPLAGADVVEIGAGLGALTEILLQTAAHVYAVELDAALAARTWSGLRADRLTVVLGDALEISAALFPPEAVYAGNLPYYITTPLAEMMLTRRPPALALMVQQEAACRFFARPGDKVYGGTAVLTQLYYDARQLLTLEPESYWPRPDVRSAVVVMRRRADAPAEAPAAVLALVRSCLAMRRKTLINNLRGRPGAAEAIDSLGLAANVRGEELAPADFLALYRALAAAGEAGRDG